MNCPRCQAALTHAEATTIAAQRKASMRKAHSGGKGGRPKGTAPRCACGAMTAKRAAARGHVCEALPSAPACQHQHASYSNGLWRCDECAKIG